MLGRVQVDNQKGGREWECITFSDIETIRGLIRFRTRYDLLFERDRASSMDSSTDLSLYEEEIICTYADLDNLIGKVKLNKIQGEILDLYMKGYDECEVAEELNIKEVTVDSTINTICKKVVEVNYEQWKSWIYWGVKRATSDYKKCSKCKEMLPATDEYFTPVDQRKDGFHPYCKECNK